VLVPFTERNDFAQRWCSSPMKTLRGRHNSLKQQTQFKILNKMLGPLASNINDSLTQAILHLPFTCREPFWTKVMFVTHENTER
jgi:hypothetical protein